MKNNKIFILLPDGIGLRNFAYSKFYELGKNEGFDPIFWNATPFDLQELNYKEIKIKNPTINKFTEIYKNARKHIELNLSIKKTNDYVYDTYRFPFVNKGIKSFIKNTITEIIIKTHTSNTGLKRVRKKMQDLERNTEYYATCYATLKAQNPAMVFCTNQRPSVAIAPLLAAKDLGIPTATFIFSWDNLPKATMVVETDYYFVWSDYMKAELIQYYPYIKESQIFVTGTPQFEAHLEKNRIQEREIFFKEYQLDLNKKYICFSGDDVTTSPDDPQYLNDTVKAIKELNTKGLNLGIIFRRCPVDFSGRYDKIIAENKDVIVNLPPLWKKIGGEWNTILPTKEDIDLQQNTIDYTEMVVNLGSSMVFDYALHNKPCAFINYDAKDKKITDWSVLKIYNYVHFRSMPNKEAVLWLNNPEEIKGKIEKILNSKGTVVSNAQKWFEVINTQDPQNASRRIWEGISEIIN